MPEDDTFRTLEEGGGRPCTHRALDVPRGRAGRGGARRSAAGRGGSERSGPCRRPQPQPHHQPQPQPACSDVSSVECRGVLLDIYSEALLQ